jgi:hypothetical protein
MLFHIYMDPILPRDFSRWRRFSDQVITPVEAYTYISPISAFRNNWYDQNTHKDFNVP